MRVYVVRDPVLHPVHGYVRREYCRRLPSRDQAQHSSESFENVVNGILSSRIRGEVQHPHVEFYDPSLLRREVQKVEEHAEVVVAHLLNELLIEEPVFKVHHASSLSSSISSGSHGVLSSSFAGHFSCHPPKRGQKYSPVSGSRQHREQNELRLISPLSFLELACGHRGIWFPVVCHVFHLSISFRLGFLISLMNSSAQHTAMCGWRM